MRRVMLFALLALALPAAVLADSIPFFETGMFDSGTIARNSEGGLETSFRSFMDGSTARIGLFDITLMGTGCAGTTGTCTFDSGIVVVQTPPPTLMVLFVGSLVDGHVTRTIGGADITADVIPESRVFPTGAFVKYFAKFTETSDGDLTGDRALVAPVPEPRTLGLLGTGVIGLAGLARRRLKLGR